MSEEISKPAENEPDDAGSEPGEDTETTDPEVVLHGEDDDAAGCFSNVCAGNHSA